jgi:hypothetical protein
VLKVTDRREIKTETRKCQGKKTAMALLSRAHQLLEKATAVLALSDEDLIYKGIAAGVSERLIALKKATARLQEQYGSLEELERKIQTEEVSPDDHTLYTDLLEWRAIQHEQAELLHLSLSGR